MILEAVRAAAGGTLAGRVRSGGHRRCLRDPGRVRSGPRGPMRAWLAILRERHPNVTWVAADTAATPSRSCRDEAEWRDRDLRQPQLSGGGHASHADFGLHHSHPDGENLILAGLLCHGAKRARTADLRRDCDRVGSLR